MPIPSPSSPFLVGGETVLLYSPTFSTIVVCSLPHLAFYHTAYHSRNIQELLISPSSRVFRIHNLRPGAVSLITLLLHRNNIMLGRLTNNPEGLLLAARLASGVSFALVRCLAASAKPFFLFENLLRGATRS
ncbi:hypothetical protein FRC12_005695, partial [Ceratobasidium sp. 428]